MTAKHKLNAAYLNGSLVIAGALGLMTQSFTVFFVAAAVLIVSSYATGHIR